MGLIKCKYCGNDKSDFVVYCPHCGKDFEGEIFKGENDEGISKNNEFIISNQPIDVKVVNEYRLFKIHISAFIFYLAGFISIGYGFYKILVYENPESVNSESINAYVGGDAYNYIINSNYFIGFNVLGLSLILIATTIVITGAILNKNK